MAKGEADHISDLPTSGIQLTLLDRTAETSVFLHPSGDHIVIRYDEIGSWARERAVIF